MPDRKPKPKGSTDRKVAYPRILEAAFSEPWAILPAKLDAIVEVIDRQVVNGLPPVEAYYDAITRMRISGQTVAGGGTYVLPIRGTIAPFMDIMMALSGGTTTKEIRSEINQAVNDPEIDTILLDIHSPGGSVFDIDELAADIFAAREKKQIVAMVNCQCASAAYYLASQAHKIIVTPSGEAGSIGVVMVHADFSKFNEDKGIAYSYITYGQHKAEGNEDAPLDDEARAHFQARVNQYGQMFDAAVARGRGVDVETVRSQFGQGRMYGATEAVERGLADRVASMAELASEFGASRARVERDATRQRLAETLD